MKRRLLSEIVNYQGQADRLVLATIIRAGGSSPRHAGAQMLILPAGESRDTIGGGPMEGEVIEQARQLLKEGGTGKVSFNLTNEEVAAAGGMCGGEVTVFLETIEVEES